MQPSLKKRLLIVSLALLIQFNYSIATRVLTGGIIPKLPIDIFPLIPVWVIPYTLWYAFILWAGIRLLVKGDERTFRSFAAGFVCTCTLGVLTFYLFPTYIIDPALPGTDVFSKLLRYMQGIDGNYAAFPSAHVYVTTILVIFYNRWYPKYFPFWLFIYIMISLSTLFTHQHYILDVAGGTVYAWIGYRFGLWWVERNQSLRPRNEAIE
ncbi:MAG: phosphatase PAP2 family protein [Anaerolineales bacterium]|nr:phosphatase PAP2 family protein [Anaerolineales bacterium]